MRLRADGRLRISATDLSGFLACKHLTLLNLAKAHKTAGLPAQVAGYGALKDLERRGLEHEAGVLQSYRSTGWSITEIPSDVADEEKVVATAEAVDARADVIYQGALEGDGQFGYPDFLVLAQLFDPETGREGSYEVVDAKLAHSAKAAAVLQTTFYSRLLAATQGMSPEFMQLELGDGTRERLRVDDFAAYERATFARMQELIAASIPIFPIVDPYPEKVEHCSICSWRDACRARRRQDDDLSLVAGAALKQRRRLKEAGIQTMTVLASLDADARVENLSKDSLTKLRLQAAAQKRTTDPENPYWELADGEDALRAQLLNAEAHQDRDVDVREPLRGLFALPEPSPGDLFFDLEAARFYGGGAEGFGLEYLFGVVDAWSEGGDGPRYVTRWAFDRDDERAAFEWFIAFVHERWRQDPGMHVYHYNHYEPTAMDRLADRHKTMTEMLGELMGRYATKEDETDALLRNRVFTDLYPIFRQAIRAGIESYSLKQTEKVAGFHRTQLLDEADEYLLAFQRSLDAGADQARSATEAQRIIAAYNEDDCRATLQLRDWLEQRRSELGTLLGAPIPRPPRIEIELEPETDLEGLKRQLRTPIAGDPDAWNQARVLLADLLEFQKRDEKPAWWEYFELRTLDEEALLASRHALAGLTYLGPERDQDGIPVRHGSRRYVHGFTFPAQEHGFDLGDRLYDPRSFHVFQTADDDGNRTVRLVDGKPWEILTLEESTGLLRLAASALDPDPSPTAFVPGKPGMPRTPSKSLLRMAEAVRDRGLLAERRAGAHLLIAEDPILKGGIPIPPTQEPVSAFAVQVARDLGPTFLAIQGPPGTGKTYTGAKIALDQVTRSSDIAIGITGPSHQAVRNFLDELVETRATTGAQFAIGQYSHDPEDLSPSVDAEYTDLGEARDALSVGDISVLGGTVWLWANEQMERSVDTLIVDEAGQVSLAFALAASAGTRDSLILLGDPQQLAQVSQGTHPDGSGESALQHVLSGERVMPEGRGLFIDRTRRMNDRITAFVSDAFYLGKLEVEPGLGLSRQEVIGEAKPAGSGLRVRDVIDVGNDSSSPEEARVVAKLMTHLLGLSWVDANGIENPIAADDIMVVTPYNAQIREISRAVEAIGLPAAAVGTVDRFQGDESPVVIYSMASSSAEDAPRGMEFLYQQNRLNVAVSRARALAIVVMSPELVRVDCKTPRQIQLANSLCLLRERSSG